MTDLIDLLDAAGLTGRGGAGFSTAVKVRAAREHRAEVIVNACDGEVGAAKDAWIVERHLPELLEGVALVTGGRGRVRFAAHRDSVTATRLVAAGLELLAVPHRYVSSEESALIALAGGRPAKPMTKRAPFVFGGRDSQGRAVPPTVVLNAETVWRVAQIHRLGPGWFHSFGTRDEPGPRLVAVGGTVDAPGVVEAAAGVRLSDLLERAGVRSQVRYVGVGGLGGVVLTRADAEQTRWDTPTMRRHGGSLGPGVLTAWDPSECPIDIASRLISYGAGESAGQCGPCMFGLPSLAAAWVAFGRRPSVAGRAQLATWLDLLAGRGACHHPDGVARFTRSALGVLAPEFAAHADGVCLKEGVAHVVHA